MDLVQSLMSQLGVDQNQAQGGAGVLLDYAKQKLGGDFDQVSQFIPNLDDLLKRGQQVDKEAKAEAESSGGGGLLGVLGGIASKAGFGDVAKYADLLTKFQKLGLSVDQITGFVKTILAFVESKGGGAVKEILNKVLTQK